MGTRIGLRGSARLSLALGAAGMVAACSSDTEPDQGAEPATPASLWAELEECGLTGDLRVTSRETPDYSCEDWALDGEVIGVVRSTGVWLSNDGQAHTAQQIDLAV